MGILAEHEDEIRQRCRKEISFQVNVPFSHDSETIIRVGSQKIVQELGRCDCCQAYIKNLNTSGFHECDELCQHVDNCPFYHNIGSFYGNDSNHANTEQDPTDDLGYCNSSRSRDWEYYDGQGNIGDIRNLLEYQNTLGGGPGGGDDGDEGGDERRPGRRLLEGYSDYSSQEESSSEEYEDQNDEFYTAERVQPYHEPESDLEQHLDRRNLNDRCPYISDDDPSVYMYLTAEIDNEVPPVPGIDPDRQPSEPDPLLPTSHHVNRQLRFHNLTVDNYNDSASEGFDSEASDE